MAKDGRKFCVWTFRPDPVMDRGGKTTKNVTRDEELRVEVRLDASERRATFVATCDAPRVHETSESLASLYKAVEAKIRAAGTIEWSPVHLVSLNRYRGVQLTPGFLGRDPKTGEWYVRTEGRDFTFAEARQSYGKPRIVPATPENDAVLAQAHETLLAAHALAEKTQEDAEREVGETLDAFAYRGEHEAVAETA